MTVTEIDSSQGGGRNFIICAWLASTTVIYNNPVLVVFIINGTDSAILSPF
jgi:hypothetical protein